MRDSSIEVFYDRDRLHPTLGNKTPSESLVQYYAVPLPA
jgi:hypothetical protein